jgi:hypothetical protein
MRPPFHLIDLIEVDRDFFSGRLGCRFQRPGRLVRVDGVGEVSLYPEKKYIVSQSRNQARKDRDKCMNDKI